MFFEPERTQFDLNFRLFGIPVRVHPLFWLISAILGYWSLDLGIEYLLIWIGCVFVSILIHEMGHVCMGLVFGAQSHIVLYSLGGLAIGSNNIPGRWRRIAVSFAGPLAQFLLYGLIIWLIPRVLDLGQAGPLTGFALRALIGINLLWPLLNLLPIWPLDGGRISRELLDWLMPSNGIRFSLGLSFLVAAIMAVNELTSANGHPLLPYVPTSGSMYNAMFFAMFAVSSFQSMQLESQKPWRRHDPWDRD